MSHVTSHFPTSVDPSYCLFILESQNLVFLHSDFCLRRKVANERFFATNILFRRVSLKVTA